MEKEQNHPKISLESSSLTSLENPKAEAIKTSLKMKYEAEKHQIIRRIGGIEDVRAQLGLSKRKMAQLLLVDPSAWTRWIKNPESVSPGTYRALEWYLIVQKKHPALSDGVWLNFLGVKEQKKSEKQIESMVENRVFDSEKRILRKLDSALLWKQARQIQSEKVYLMVSLFLTFICGVVIGLAI